MTFVDHVKGAESDSGLEIKLDDPACGGCGESHRVAVSRIGLFCFTCRGSFHRGTVDGFRDILAQYEAQEQLRKDGV